MFYEEMTKDGVTYCRSAPGEEWRLKYPPLTLQQVFDNAWNQAKTMAGFATNAYGVCLYRSPNGPCLIGASIPDEQYRQSLEDQPAHLLVVPVFELLSGNEKDIMRHIQRVHDSVARGDYFNGDFNEEARTKILEKLKDIARIHNLTIPN